MITHNRYTYFLTCLLIIASIPAISQSEWKNWDGVNLNLDITKKLGFEANHLRSYNINKAFENSFNQWGIGVDYKITKRLSMKVAYKKTFFPADTVSTNRLQARLTYRIRLADEINWYNGIQGEVHSAQENRFTYRIIFRTRLVPKRRLPLFRLSPSVSYWLYYNIGGNALQYYDEIGSPLVRETPDGIHRGRFILNLNSKINNNLSFSLYYINQHEFNLTGKKINIINPGTGKIARPFNNYQVIGASLTLSFDLYKKKSKKKSEHATTSEK